ncbi:phage tail tube protein [Anaerocolumna chitinilytica]|uniref:Phage portal protein n=1 Tax=Anaerocolumna chitinilytica TaxID=1727145 RepID=A0A7I8DRG3_9FIRM|nr:phage tail tube protein [Anaerocolumna chitinilytica]BCK00863.1 phage portal protein [Anaerocolumna chitinilytica]
MTGNKLMSGTWGEVWLDSEYVAECFGAQAKATFTKEDVNICGKMAVDKKITAIAYTGSLKMHKVNSRMAMAIGEKIKNGTDVRFKVITKLADPDAYGAERIVLNNVSFDDLTLADWEVAKMGSIEAPFTFTDYEFLDSVEA